MSDLDKKVEWKVVDTSKFQQGKVDHKKLKAEGYKGIIIRANDPDTYMGKDPFFESDYKSAKEAGLYVGAYWFTMATTIDYAMKEAEKFAEYTEGKQFDLPLYIDLENSPTLAKGMSFCTELIDKVCTYLQYEKKKFIGVYCSSGIYPYKVEKRVRDKFCCWIADYRGYVGYQDSYGIWQTGYTRTAAYCGGKADIDADICYVDYPTAIKNRGLNGFPKPQPKPELIYKTTKDTPIVSIKGVEPKGKTVKIGGRKTVCGVQYGRIDGTPDDWISLKDAKQVK